MEQPKITSKHIKTISVLPKVTDSDCVYVACPYGKQCYVWFNDLNCTIIEKHTKRSWIIKVVFNPLLADTIFSGTLTTHNGQSIFIFDAVLKVKGVDIVANYKEQSRLFIECISLYVNNHASPTLFMLPLTSSTFIDFKPVYKLYSVKIFHDMSAVHYIPKSKLFTVRSTQKSDIYELYIKTDLHSIAYIDTIIRSQEMNNLFHENNSKIEQTMECHWSDLFSKWIPIKVI